MRRLLNCAGAAVTLFALLMVGVRAAGGMIKPVSALILDVERCEQPCWRGIYPGQTSIEEVPADLMGDDRVSIDTADDGFSNERCWTIRATTSIQSWEACAAFWFTSGNLVHLLRLNPPQGQLTLGDALTFFGQPLAAKLCWWNGSIPNMPAYFIRAKIIFKDKTEVWAYNLRHPLQTRLDPNMLIYSVRYQFIPDNSPYRFGDVRWPGFTQVGKQKMC